jgi:hypothetical protein
VLDIALLAADTARDSTYRLPACGFAALTRFRSPRPALESAQEGSPSRGTVPMGPRRVATCSLSAALAAVAPVAGTGHSSWAVSGVARCEFQRAAPRISNTALRCFWRALSLSRAEHHMFPFGVHFAKIPSSVIGWASPRGILFHHRPSLFAHPRPSSPWWPMALPISLLQLASRLLLLLAASLLLLLVLLAASSPPSPYSLAAPATEPARPWPAFRVKGRSSPGNARRRAAGP